MTWRVRQEVEDALWLSSRAALPPQALVRKTLVRAVERRSALYTSEREHLRGPQGPADAAARALFFSIADAAKIAVPLAELASAGLLEGGRELRVLDVGAGFGAMTLGLVSWIADSGLSMPISVLACDADAIALEVFAGAAEYLARAGLPRIAVETRTCDLRSGVGSLSSSCVDLVVLGSVLNELEEDEALDLVRDLLGNVSADGSLIVIEPALRDTSRRLHRLRDVLLGEGAAHVFAPCVRTDLPCPVLADDHDWCHEDRPVELPEKAAQIAGATGLRDGAMKFSYLVLRRSSEGLVEVPPGSQAHRVVSRPRKTKGQLECWGCSQKGRVRLRRLSRNRSEANRMFDRVRRGDVVLVGAGDERAGLLDLLRSTEVNAVAPARPPR